MGNESVGAGGDSYREGDVVDSGVVGYIGQVETNRRTRGLARGLKTSHGL